MVVLREFRIPMPMSVEEYQTAQLYMTAKSTRMEAERENGAKVEVLKNEQCEHPQYGKGQFTLKVYHMHNKLPGWLRALIPKKKAVLREESYNCFPHIETTLTLDMFSKFKVVIRSEHLDRDTEADNVHNLSKKELKTRTVEYIDIVSSKMSQGSTANLGKEDPTKFKSAKTMRGPLKKNWQAKAKPVMCAYKLVKAEFDYFGLRTKVEDFVLGYEKDLFLSSHKQMFCWIDQWYGLSMNQIRQIEAEEMLETNAAAKRTSSIDQAGKSSATPTMSGGIVPASYHDDTAVDAAMQDDISDNSDEEAEEEERRLARQPRGKQAEPETPAQQRRRPPPPPPQSTGTAGAAGVGLKQPGTGDLEAYLREQEQRREAAARVVEDPDVDDIDSDDDDDDDAVVSTRQQQQQQQQRPKVAGKDQGLLGKMAGKMAGMAVSQMQKHSTAETWEGKYGIDSSEDKAGKKKGKKQEVAEDESSSDEEEDGGSGRWKQQRTGLQRKKEDATEEEDATDEEDDSDEEGPKKPGKQGRLCYGGLFGSKSSWVALCNGVRKDEDMEGDMSSEEDVPSARQRSAPAQRKSQVPSWGETISSMNWSKAQWKLQHESDRLGQKVTQKGVEAIESVVAGTKAVGEKVEELRMQVTGQRDSSYPLYRGED